MMKGLCRRWSGKVSHSPLLPNPWSYEHTVDMPPGLAENLMFMFCVSVQTLNYMAVATMLLYQDRCTKNWCVACPCLFILLTLTFGGKHGLLLMTL
jgi:hypothetical protein